MICLAWHWHSKETWTRRFVHSNNRYANGRAIARPAQHLRKVLAARDYRRGVDLAGQARWDEAATAFRGALNANPAFAEAHNNLALMQGYQKQFEAAAASLRRALELKPDYAEAHNNLALLLKDQKKLDEAAAAFRRALEIEPALAEAQNNLALVLKDQNKLDEAASGLRRAIEINPDYATAHWNLGNVLTHLGETAEAAACFQRALDLQPNFVVAHNSLLQVLHYQPGITLARLAAAHREFDRRHCAPLRAGWRPLTNLRDPRGSCALGSFRPISAFIRSASSWSAFWRTSIVTRLKHFVIPAARIPMR